MARLTFMLFALLVVAAGCNRGDSLQQAGSSTQVAEVAASNNDFSTAPGPSVTPSGKNVTLDTPRSGEPLTTNPFTVAGTARTFENQVALRVLDEDGRLIQQSSAIAAGQPGSFSPWTRSILLIAYPGQKLTVEAVEISPKDGSTRSIARASVPFRVLPRTLKLFFPDSTRASRNCSAVFAIDRKVPNTLSIAQASVLALIAGPTAEEQDRGFTNPFPEGSSLNSVAIANGVATVDFNEVLENVGGSCRAQAIRASVTRTLQDLPGLRQAIITAAGSQEQALQP
ncbi:MAG: Gmad2 immunoglobulin-like domain-containing protein [Acidobacteriota bacterium]